MKRNQAWGWLAAGVLAAGLNASYYDGGMQWAHRIADRVGQHSEAAAALASGQAKHVLAEARMFTVRSESVSCPLSRAVARVQSRIARSQGRFDKFEAMSAREQAQLAKLEENREAQIARTDANRGRMEARMAAHTARFRIATAAFAPISFKAMSVPVVCPRVRVHIPQPSMVEMPAIPEIHVEMAGTGPV